MCADLLIHLFKMRGVFSVSLWLSQLPTVLAILLFISEV